MVGLYLMKIYANVSPVSYQEYNPTSGTHSYPIVPLGPLDCLKIGYGTVDRNISVPKSPW